MEMASGGHAAPMPRRAAVTRTAWRASSQAKVAAGSLGPSPSPSSSSLASAQSSASVSAHSGGARTSFCGHDNAGVRSCRELQSSSELLPMNKLACGDGAQQESSRSGRLTERASARRCSPRAVSALLLEPMRGHDVGVFGPKAALAVATPAGVGSQATARAEIVTSSRARVQRLGASRCNPSAASAASSAASTRTPSPQLARSASRWQAPLGYSELSRRLKEAEDCILEKDQRLEWLEHHVRELSVRATPRPIAANSEGCAGVGASCATKPGDTTSAGGEAAEEDLLADVEALVVKSDELLRKMSDLGVGEEPERQWAALMAAHEECKERLALIEALVQRRVDQLPVGDSELRVCRAVRGLCVGAQRAVSRRWALGSK